MRTWRPAPWLVLTIVGLVALALRLAFLFRAPVFIIGDSENYFWPGYQLAREIGFDLDLRADAGLPAVHRVVVTRIGEDLAALALAQHLLGVVTCLLVAGLGDALLGAWTGLLAGLLVALSGPLLVAEQYVMAETLFIPLATLTVAWLAAGAGAAALVGAAGRRAADRAGGADRDRSGWCWRWRRCWRCQSRRGRRARPRTASPHGGCRASARPLSRERERGA